VQSLFLDSEFGGVFFRNVGALQFCIVKHSDLQIVEMVGRGFVFFILCCLVNQARAQGETTEHPGKELPTEQIPTLLS
jgi:hypothetical protein